MNLNTNNRGRGCGRGSCGQGQGRGRGHGGRSTRAGGNSHHPYSLGCSYHTSFTAESRLYSREEWDVLTSQRQQAVIDLKSAEGWVDGGTPPPGFVTDNRGYHVPSSRLVAAVQQYTAGASNANLMPPPPPNDLTSIPPIVDTDPSRARASFGCSGVGRGDETSGGNPGDSGSVSQVSMVSINGHSYNGPVFDASGNQITLMICQLCLFLGMIGCYLLSWFWIEQVEQ